MNAVPVRGGMMLSCCKRKIYGDEMQIVVVGLFILMSQFLVSVFRLLSPDEGTSPFSAIISATVLGCFGGFTKIFQHRVDRARISKISFSYYFFHGFVVIISS